MPDGLLAPPLRAALYWYPFLSGRASLLRHQPFRRLVGKDRVALARLHDGGRLYVKVDDLVGRPILLTGDYDPKITWLCKRVLRPGDTMLDVGANLGVVAAYGARLVGDLGTVHAFEPQPDLVELMTRSMAVNGYRQVTIHPIGLSDVDQQLPLYGYRSNLGAASLHADGEDDPIIATVQVRRAAEVLESLALGPIRMLKLDVEGHEEPFLRSATSYLRSNTPDVIAFESHGDQAFSERPVVSMLRDLGYEFFQVPKALLVMKLLPIRGDKTSKGFDFVAIRASSDLIRTLT